MCPNVVSFLKIINFDFYSPELQTHYRPGSSFTYAHDIDPDSRQELSLHNVARVITSQQNCRYGL
jgi:hypothetical protein